MLIRDSLSNATDVVAGNADNEIATAVRDVGHNLSVIADPKMLNDPTVRAGVLTVLTDVLRKLDSLRHWIERRAAWVPVTR